MSGRGSPPNKYRRLAAKPLPIVNDITFLTETGTGTIPTPSSRPPDAAIRPMRKTINVACESCRKRKIKCDGTRPRCSSCESRELMCQYPSAYRGENFTAALKRRCMEENEKTTSFQEIFSTLQSCSDKDAMNMFNLVRQGVDPKYLLKQMKECDFVFQLAVVPETRRRYQFPYLPTMPIRLQTPDNQYLKSVLYETVFLRPDDESSDGGSASSSADTQLGRHHNVYMRPYHAAEVIDPLIDLVKPSKWTAVIADDRLMRALLRAYFLHEYPTFPVFHKDIFLQAMINNDKRFCSSLLVNALLAEACHCHMGIPNREQFWVPQSLRYRFLAEAIRLWELENIRVDLVTVQAATLLNLVYSHNGMDKIGEVYLNHALQKAQQLDLFGDHATIDNERMFHARVFSAWALFDWQCIQSYYYYRAPLIPDPPAVPLPDPERHPFWYGDFMLKYPLSSTLVPAQCGQHFKAVSGLRAIIHDMATIGYSQTPYPEDSLEPVLAIFSRLEKWFSELPDALSPQNIVFPWQLKLHMELYLATILFSSKQIGISEPSTIKKETAYSTASHAAARLETITRLYYIRHSFEYSDSFLTIHLSFVAGAAMDALKTTPAHETSTARSLRSTIILSLKGLYDQGQHIHLTSVIYRLLRDRLEPKDLELLQNHVDWDPLTPEEPLLVQYAQSHYPLTMGSKEADPDGARLENLVKQYDQLGFEEDKSPRP
ncbi:uncharacterized protein TrAFT101_000603 [Trichoderma asperellum]|uniref:uncharacterized protein n=1 Tax=Trichoderma asperellum TaxID=101201 RepID=UPI00332ED303|nr:hypothetical protein TrAFT101_000603 [Trichoderma asperellum]